MLVCKVDNRVVWCGYMLVCKVDNTGAVAIITNISQLYLNPIEAEGVYEP